MRILILDPCYPQFLSSFYAEHPQLLESSYSAQWRALMDQFFGAADFYSANLVSLGCEAEEVVPNAEPLQLQWAKENNLKLENQWAITKRGGVIPWPRRVRKDDCLYAILVAQVKHYRPDVLYIQDINNTSRSFLREVRPYVRLIAGQIACPIAPETNFREYDLLISSFPHYVE